MARKIGLPLLTLYGLGTMLGAGIYVLVGKVAAYAGMLAPLSFIVAAIIAYVTALSYCELVSRFPQSAGEACYVEQGFHRRYFGIIVGYLVVFTGIVSSATLINGFVGYLNHFVELPRHFSISVMLVLLGLIAIWGIAESLWFAALITVIEVFGLLLVITIAGSALPATLDLQQAFIPESTLLLGGVLSGAFLAFYAFIGFEDMVNIVEEVKSPSKTMPRGIILAFISASLLYVIVALVAVFSLPLEQLAASDAPLKDILVRHHPLAGTLISVISLFAILNGILVQIIMAARVLYGMAHQERAPAFFAKVNSKTHTPIIATIIITAIVCFFALWLPIVTLAKTTSFIILIIFALVNLSLWRVQRQMVKNKENSRKGWPITGALLCLFLLGVQIFSYFFT
ncbi:APC family permease [Shewanella schlegeliana]|uniref:APC family permease n=1 Tax=Shewanella schlegeliana TaxID=190308 RepID=UPI001ED934B4|nr:APC family permease [Shewanella schlegeliana]MCL1111065.1 APC family permease [Shewanella schlegeliana]